MAGGRRRPNCAIGTEAEEKFAVTENMLAGYPEPFFSRFSVLAIEAALASGNDHEAADWLDRLEAGPHDPKADAAITYLHGVLHAKAGRAQAAEEAWKEVAASNDRLYKIRAELALIDLGVANGSLTPGAGRRPARGLAFRLARRRSGGRYPAPPRRVLYSGRNVKAGLEVLAQAVQLYPDSPLTPKIHAGNVAYFPRRVPGRPRQKTFGARCADACISNTAT